MIMDFEECKSFRRIIDIAFIGFWVKKLGGSFIKKTASKIADFLNETARK